MFLRGWPSKRANHRSLSSGKRDRWNIIPCLEATARGVSTNPEFQAIVERLEKVEKENFMLKGFGITILLLVGTAGAMGQPRPTRTVEAGGTPLVAYLGGMK